MSWAATAFILCLIISVVLILGSIYVLIMLTDLESDYINPVDLCTKLNSLIIPEMGLQAVIPLLLVLSGNWYSFAFNLPLVVFNIQKLITKKYRLDATDIFRNLNNEKIAWGVRLGFYLFSLFLYLYRMIVCLVEDIAPNRSSS